MEEEDFIQCYLVDLLCRRRMENFFQKYKNTKCRVFEVEVSNEQYNGLIIIIKYMKKNQFVKPKDFENIDIFNLIYTGKYALYR